MRWGRCVICRSFFLVVFFLLWGLVLFVEKLGGGKRREEVVMVGRGEGSGGVRFEERRAEERSCADVPQRRTFRRGTTAPGRKARRREREAKRAAGDPHAADKVAGCAAVRRGPGHDPSGEEAGADDGSGSGRGNLSALRRWDFGTRGRRRGRGWDPLGMCVSSPRAPFLFHLPPRYPILYHLPLSLSS